MSDFTDWKAHPITKRVFEGLKEQELILTDSLVTSAGVDAAEDRFKVGYIAALRDVYLIRLEDEGDAK
jgi:hypothetical protein